MNQRLTADRALQHGLAAGMFSTAVYAIVPIAPIAVAPMAVISAVAIYCVLRDQMPEIPDVAPAESAGRDEYDHPLLILPQLSGFRELRQSVSLRNLPTTILCAAAITVQCFCITVLYAVADHRIHLVYLSTTFAAGTWAYVGYRRAQRWERPFTWLCPNATCPARHTSERVPWRCGYCQGVNEDTDVHSILTHCGCGDCRRAPDGYRCPHCHHAVVFGEAADHRRVATAPNWRAPAVVSSQERKRTAARERLRDLRAEDEVRNLDRAADELRRSLEPASANRLESLMQAAERKMLAVQRILEFRRVESAKLADQYHDPLELERHGTRLDELVDQMLTEIERSDRL